MIPVKVTRMGVGLTNCSLNDYSRLDSEVARQAVDRIVIVPHNCHYNQNGWLKYDHRVMYKKYTTPLPYSWDVG